MKDGNYTFGSDRIIFSEKYNKIVYKKILAKTGISKVYQCNIHENARTLAIASAKKIAKKYRNKIDGLIYTTQTPNETIPSSGTVIHNCLNLNSNCFVIDIIQGCSSLPYILNMTGSLLKNKQIQNFLLIFSETYRKYIKDKKSSSYPIFSDAASCIYFEKKSFPKILSSIYIADGSGKNNLFLSKNNHLIMNGPEVYNFTLKNVPQASEKLIKKAKLNIGQIDYFIFHQASKIIIKNIISSLKIPKDKVYYNLINRGNTVSNTLPIALIDMFKQKKIKNKKILIMGFGVGYSLSGGIYNF